MDRKRKGVYTLKGKGALRSRGAAIKAEDQRWNRWERGQEGGKPLPAPVPSDSIAGPFFTFSYRKAMVRPAITMLTIDISLMRMFSDGPEVSLNGSPTVSPTIVDL